MKISYSFFLILFLLSSITTTTAQVGTLGAIRIDGEGQIDIIGISTGNCTPTFPIKVFLANLEISNEGYNIPATYPPMYLESSVNGSAPQRVELKNFDFEEFYQSTGTPIYSTVVHTAPEDISRQCVRDALIDMSIDLRLVTPNDRGGWDDYPACDYSASDDIFSCNVFLNAGTCYSNDLSGEGEGLGRTDDVPCDNSALVNRNYNQRVKCPECRGESRDQGLINPLGGIEANAQTLSVYPNPVSNTMTVEWTKADQPERLNLYRIDGSLIKTWTPDQFESRTILEVQTDFLDQGIYFLEAQSADNSKVIKVVKQ